MLVALSRFRVPEEAVEGFRPAAATVLAGLSGRPGYVEGSLARAVDDPGVWLLLTRWESAGAYRRALGDFGVRTALMPLQQYARDEPGGYEVVAEGRAGEVREAETDTAADWARAPGPIRRDR